MGCSCCIASHPGCRRRAACAVRTWVRRKLLIWCLWDVPPPPLSLDCSPKRELQLLRCPWDLYCFFVPCSTPKQASSLSIFIFALACAVRHFQLTGFLLSGVPPSRWSQTVWSLTYFSNFQAVEISAFSFSLCFSSASAVWQRHRQNTWATQGPHFRDSLCITGREGDQVTHVLSNGKFKALEMSRSGIYHKMVWPIPVLANKWCFKLGRGLNALCASVCAGTEHLQVPFFFFLPLFPYLCVLLNDLFLHCYNSVKGDISFF